MDLKKKTVLFLNVCIAFACLCVGILAYKNADDAFSAVYIGKVSDDAKHLSMLLDKQFPGKWQIKDGRLYKGDRLMEDLTDGIDGIAGDDAITIFRGNMRVSTTIKQEGSRAVGTQAGDKVVEAVIGRGETLAVETDVLGVPCFTCYLPIVSESGERIGMFFVGAPSAPVIEVQHRFVRNMILTILVLVMIMGVLATGIITKQMMRILEVQKTLAAIAGGDLSGRDIELNGNDEISKLGQDTNRMKKAMRAIMENIASSAEQVAGGAKNISDSSMVLSQGAAQQASSVEELSASIAEISSQTKSNANNAERANTITVVTRANAEAGNEDMLRMLQAMEEINTSSDDISKIIKVIDEIAFQTNILALNAAVEAARAGQHGKGFAVVAEEVRNLAARSAKAAKETTAMIENSIAKVDNGQVSAHQAAEKLKTIVANVSEVADLVESIAKASKEQSLAIEQINQGVLQVSQVVQANSATSEESASASEELSRQAELLSDEVRKFKI
ncbi:Methyl-accepting chemotaxis protein [Selenomonas sp. GACV-9]|uniref:methyl-accepting chemotaxis protein n=1 Tax=Selenomonas sp. GACV-9 TaxID=3158782 RepID=UPI0008F33264|nr:Methyl-accepting chemotaxis protein [Selenomonas ruminantium]